MANQLKLYHKILPFILIPISLVIAATYGLIGFDTLTEKPGLNGSWYSYFRLTRSQFYIYNFAMAVIALWFVIFLAKYLIDRNSKYLTKTFWRFTVFIGIIILCELYLQYRFGGKG